MPLPILLISKSLGVYVMPKLLPVISFSIEVDVVFSWVTLLLKKGGRYMILLIILSLFLAMLFSMKILSLTSPLHHP